MSHGQRVLILMEKYLCFKNKFLNFSWTKKRELQPLVSYKRVSCKQIRVQALREECPNTEVFLVRIFRIPTEYGEVRTISPYSARMRENTDQKKLCHIQNPDIFRT